MRRRLRILVVVASTFAMVLMLNVGTAFAHPNEPATPNNPFNADNAVFKTGLDTAGGPQVAPDYWIDIDGIRTNIGPIPSNIGIAQGYFAHSPTCVLHPDLSH